MWHTEMEIPEAIKNAFNWYRSVKCLLSGCNINYKIQNRHVSLPGRYTDVDFTDWLERFAAANKLDKKTRALKLPTLLEKEAFVAWLSIPEETRKDYDEVKQLTPLGVQATNTPFTLQNGSLVRARTVPRNASTRSHCSTAEGTRVWRHGGNYGSRDTVQERWIARLF